MEENKAVIKINIENIIPNRFQPRLTFNEDDLNSLARSIKEHGVIQPIIVRKINDKYEIIAGERRYKASVIAGLTEIPAIEVNISDDQSAEVALVENIQRKNLSSLEEAQSYSKILKNGKINQEELAKKVGISQPNIANKLRLLNLTEEVKNALMNDKISERHARSLLQITDDEGQIAMLNRVIKERLTVRQLDEEIKKWKNSQTEDVNQSEVNLMSASKAMHEEPPQIADEIPKQIINPLDIDTKEVKEKAQDIIPKEINPFFNLFNQNNFPSLEDTAANLSVTGVEPLISDDNDLEVPKAEEIILPKKENTPIVKQEKRIIPNNLNSVINAYDDLQKEVEDANYKISTENFDFEDIYQIIIKIDKTNG